MRKALLAGMMLAAASNASAFDRGLSGLWYNPAQSGHGFEVTAIDADTASVAWYTYNKSGDPIWVSALLDETAPGVLSGPASYIEGIKFGEFSSAGRQLKPWGTLKLTFTACDTASVDYNGTLVLTDGTGFGAGTLPLKKLAGVSGVHCANTRAGVAGQYEVIQRVLTPLRERGGLSLLEADGSVTIGLPGYGAFFGTYTVNAAGALAYAMQGFTIVGIQLPNGATNASYTGTVAGRQADFYAGTYTSTAESGTLSQSWVGAGTRTVSLAGIAGNYNDPGGGSGYTAVIGANGSITGTRPTNCTYTGTLAPTAEARAFNVNITIANCGSANGAYTGKAMPIDYTDFGDSRALFFVLKGTNNAITVSMRRQ